MRRRLAILLAGLVLAACGHPAPQNARPETPMRIVSLDYCADQYVLQLVEKERILAVSPDAVSDFSYLRKTADAVASVRPLAEDVILLQPDLVVRSYGGGPRAEALFERAGIPVLNIGWTNDIESVRAVTREMADGLGAADQGDRLIAAFDQRLAAIKPRTDGAAALYMTSSGVTTGPGSLMHEMMQRAGVENFQQTPGWQTLPLEALAYKQPDLVIGAFFDGTTDRKDAWSGMRHPLARKQMRDRPTLLIPGATASCGAWFLIDAIEAMAEAGSDVE